MSAILNHLVVSGTNNEVTLEWNIRNPFEASLPSYHRLDSARTKVFDEYWNIAIMLYVPDLLHINILREKVKDGDSKNFYIHCKVRTINEFLSFSRHIEAPLDSAAYPYLFLGTLRKFENVTTIQIICTAKYCHLPSLETKFGQESCKDKYEFLKLTLPKGHELPSRVPRDFQELLFNKRKADLHIDVKGQMILAHQSVLEARCPAFAAMFSHNMGKNESRVIRITDCGPAPFRDFLVYLYTGKVDHIKGSNASDIYKISDKYDRPELKELCKKHILSNLSPNTLLDTLSTVDIYNDSEMLESATKYFIEIGPEIIKTIEWQDFVQEHSNLMNKIFEKLFQMNAFASMKTPVVKRRKKRKIL